MQSMQRNFTMINMRPHIDISHVCDLLDVDDLEFARMCFDERSPSVSITRVASQTFIEASCCRVLLHCWMPEKVSFFDAAMGPQAKRSLSSAEKKNVAMMQEWKCKRCSKLLRDFEVDHVEQNCIRNQNTWLQALCPSCHRAKTREDRVFGDALFEPIQRLVGKKPGVGGCNTNIFADFMCV